MIQKFKCIFWKYLNWLFQCNGQKCFDQNRSKIFKRTTKQHSSSSENIIKKTRYESHTMSMLSYHGDLKLTHLSFMLHPFAFINTWPWSHREIIYFTTTPTTVREKKMAYYQMTIWSRAKGKKRIKKKDESDFQER